MNAPAGLFAEIRAAIIDLDGTMLDTAPDFLVAINAMRAELELAPIGIGVITRFVGKGTENLMRSMIGLDFTPEQDGERYEPGDGRLSAPLPRHQWQVFDALCRRRRRTARDAAAGPAPGLRDQQADRLCPAAAGNTGLLPAFEVVYGGDSLPRKKPDPMPLLQVCADFDLAPHKVVAIGDSSNDAEAARAAGCRVLNVPYGYNHGQSIHDVDSDGIVDTLLDAARLLSAANPYQHVSQ